MCSGHHSFVQRPASLSFTNGLLIPEPGLLSCLKAVLLQTLHLMLHPMLAGKLYTAGAISSEGTGSELGAVFIKSFMNKSSMQLSAQTLVSICSCWYCDDDSVARVTMCCLAVLDLRMTFHLSSAHCWIPQMNYFGLQISGLCQ